MFMRVPVCGYPAQSPGCSCVFQFVVTPHSPLGVHACSSLLLPRTVPTQCSPRRQVGLLLIDKSQLRQSRATQHPTFFFFSKLGVISVCYYQGFSVSVPSQGLDNESTTQRLDNESTTQRLDNESTTQRPKDWTLGPLPRD